MRILVVEDEMRIAAFLVHGLRAQGYTVEHVITGADALLAARDPGFALMILDLELPDIDGADVLQRLRAEGSRLPIIALAARGDASDPVEGRGRGAHDHLTKPFVFDELLARIRALMWVAMDADPDGVVRVGDVELDVRDRRVRVGDDEHDLTAREFALLSAFMRHPGRVLSRELILSQVWEIDRDPRSNVVDVYVRHLRRKLGDTRIETVRGVGYRFVGDA